MIRPSPLTAILNRSAAACIRRSKTQPSASCFLSYPAQASPSCSYPSSNKTSGMSFSSSSTACKDMHGTTILCVRKDGKVCMMGDGQVSMGSIVVKPNAKKIRRILPKTNDTSTTPTTTTDDETTSTTKNDVGGTLVGFAGSTADAFTLLERLESKLDEYPDQLTRSCVELAKGWRTDKYLRRLEASLLVADGSISLELTGNGDVLESHDGVLSVGSGSPYASAAARALIDIPDLDAEEVARRAMEIASDMCVYTNKNFMVETIDNAEPSQSEKDKINAAAAAVEGEKDSK